MGQNAACCCSDNPKDCPLIPGDDEACFELVETYGSENVRGAISLLKSSGSTDITGENVRKAINLERSVAELAARFGLRLLKAVVDTIVV
jgi:hypothetical protein